MHSKHKIDEESLWCVPCLHCTILLNEVWILIHQRFKFCSQRIRSKYLWQRYQLEIAINAFLPSTIPQKQFIGIIEKKSEKAKCIVKEGHRNDLFRCIYVTFTFLSSNKNFVKSCCGLYSKNRNFFTRCVLSSKCYLNRSCRNLQ